MKFQNVTLLYRTNDVHDITYLASDNGPGCGGELYNYGGTFTSPGYPNTDRNNTDCTWTINVPMNLFVALQFQGKFCSINSFENCKINFIKLLSKFVVFDMGSRSCDVNYVEIIEMDENIDSIKFCGTENPAPYKARTNRLKVHFKGSTNFSGSGWVISFMAVHENTVVNEY